MTAAQFELLDADEATTLLQWRFQRLVDAGHEPVSALLMAVRPDVELGLASGLLRVAEEARADC